MRRLEVVRALICATIHDWTCKAIKDDVYGQGIDTQQGLAIGTDSQSSIGIKIITI